MAEGDNILTLDYAIEMLEGRTVETSKGHYIAVDDLKKLAEEFKEAKQSERDQMKPLRTLAQARKAALEDPELKAAFGPPPVKAPADAGVVKPVAEGTGNEAA